MKRIITLNILLGLFALIGVCLTPACFAAAPATSTSPFFPFAPRVSLDGSTVLHGTDSFSGLFYGDAMAPVYGNQEGIFYVDTTGKYDSGDEAYMFSFGAGARKIFNNIIWGGYAFADRSYTADDVRYWVANPGVEVIAPLWDVHVNGYWPISERCKTEGVFYGDEIGINDTVQFQGRDEFDNLYDLIEEAGRGADAEVGVRIPKAYWIRPFVGGYYYRFSKTNDNMGGVMGGVDAPFGPYVHLLLRDSYDNIHHNTALATLRIEFGGVSNKANSATNVESRLTDLIPRHIGTLYTGSGIPSERNIINTGRRSLERSNIWFFNPSSNGSAVDFSGATVDSNSCTAEHPCSGDQFNQANVNAINGFAPGADFYLGAGGYHLGGRIHINQGQNLFGRTSDFTLPAYFGNSLARLTGGLDLLGNNFVEAIQMLNDGQQNEGIAINNAANITLDHDMVGQPFASGGLAPDPSNYPNGIIMNGASNVVIRNSTIYAIGGDDDWVGFLPEGELASGMWMENSTGVQILDSTINVQDNSVNEQTVAVGLFELNSNFELSNTTVNVETTMDATAPESEGYVDVAGGVLAMGGNGTISNDKFNLKAEADNDVGSVAGVGNSHQTVRAIVAGVAGGDLTAVPGLGVALASFMPKAPTEVMLPTNLTVNNDEINEEANATGNGNDQHDYITMIAFAVGALGDGSVTHMEALQNIINMIGKINLFGNDDKGEAEVASFLADGVLDGGKASITSSGDVGTAQINEIAAGGTTNNELKTDDVDLSVAYASGNESQATVQSENDNFATDASLANQSANGEDKVIKTDDVFSRATDHGEAEVDVTNDNLKTAVTATGDTVTADEGDAAASARSDDGTGSAIIDSWNTSYAFDFTANATDAANVTVFGVLAQGDGAVDNVTGSDFNLGATVVGAEGSSLLIAGAGVVNLGVVSFIGSGTTMNATAQLDGVLGDTTKFLDDGGSFTGDYTFNVGSALPQIMTQPIALFYSEF